MKRSSALLARKRSGSSAAAFTLIELVFTMGLIALLLGIGLGAVASLDLGAHAAVGLVQNTLRQANNWAVARRAPARVRIDPAQGTIRAEGLDVIGTWHFEKMPPRGAFGLDGNVFGAELVDDGYIGKALTFRGMPAGARYEVDVRDDPAYNLTTGFQVHCALRPEKVAQGLVLRLGDALGIDVTSGLGLRAFFGAQRYDELGNPRPASKPSLSTPDGVLRPDRWNRVIVSYDRSELIVLVEGIVVARLPEEADVIAVDGPLVLGGGSRPWAGSIDSLVISAVGEEDAVQLPEGSSFAADSPREIAFAAGGGLDRSIHAEPVALYVELGSGERIKVQVNLFGTVE